MFISLKSNVRNGLRTNQAHFRREDTFLGEIKTVCNGDPRTLITKLCRPFLLQQKNPFFNVLGEA